MQEKNSALIGNLACYTAYAIFGFNIISCKNIAIDGNITPMALFCLRSFGATALFWIWSLFSAPHDQIEKKDIWKVTIASFLGLFMTQLSFLFAITNLNFSLSCTQKSQISENKPQKYCTYQYL